jgi:AraC family ethanolamine operon transcriptional activator
LMPVVTVQDLTDPTRLAEVKALQQDVVSLGRASFRARRVTVRFNRSVLIHHTSNHRVRSLTRTHDDYLSFLAIGRRSRAKINGLAMTSGALAVGEPGVEVELVVEANYESIAWLVAPEALERHLATRKRENDFRWPSGVEHYRSEPDLVKDFFDTGKLLSATAVSNRDLFENKRVLSSAELSMAEALFQCLGQENAAELTSVEQTAQYYGEIVRKAEQYTLNHTTHRPTISDLCESAHVSERTLQNAFREIMGMSPTAFLRRLRLHRARSALQTATYRSTTVSTVAQDWGFWHFGEFSRAYRECFGELPSETLRKRRRSFAEVSNARNTSLID